MFKAMGGGCKLGETIHRLLRHPAPLPTKTSLLVDVAGTTFANDAFWRERCASIPTDTLFIVVDVGGTRDFPSQQMLVLRNARGCRHTTSTSGVMMG